MATGAVMHLTACMCNGSHQGVFVRDGRKLFAKQLAAKEFRQARVEVCGGPLGGGLRGANAVHYQALRHCGNSGERKGLWGGVEKLPGGAVLGQRLRGERGCERACRALRVFTQRGQLRRVGARYRGPNYHGAVQA